MPGTPSPRAGAFAAWSRDACRLYTGFPALDPEDVEDLEDAPDSEVEAAEAEILDQATAARTITELKAEIAMLVRLEALALAVRYGELKCVQGSRRSSQAPSTVADSRISCKSLPSPTPPWTRAGSTVSGRPWSAPKRAACNRTTSSRSFWRLFSGSAVVSASAKPGATKSRMCRRRSSGSLRRT